MTRVRSAGWKWCALSSVAIVFLSLIPQLHFWFVRGRDWNGAYATIQGDEFLYSAYVSALIDGRPRRNDPFAGRDSTPAAPLPESSFSIQFIPAYAIALPARAFGVSASTAFIVLTVVAAALASWSVFWLIASVTGDNKVAAAGVLLVLCLGELAGDQGIVGVLLLNNKLSVFMPFLRRYQPALPLPLFFVFCALVWRAVSLERKQTARIYAALAGLVLGVLVFSYLYFWTAAAAWLACFAGLWLSFRPREERWRSIELFAITGSILIVALVAYWPLVNGRSKSLDDAQILVHTRQLDLLHTPEVIGAVILVVLVVLARRRKFNLREPQPLFIASFASVPFVVFNQQVITGRSIQPFHFDLFVMNYVVLIALVGLVKLVRPSIPNRTLVWGAALCFSWGVLEVGLLAKARTAPDLVDDQTVPVLMRLKELAPHDGTLSGLRERGNASTRVFSPHVDVMRVLPTWTSQGTLLGAGAQDFGTATRQQRKELLFLQLYYSGVDASRFRELLNQKTEDRYLNFYAPSVMFGDERFIPALSIHYQPIQPEEIEAAVRAYQTYLDSLSVQTILQHQLTYLVTSGEQEWNISNVDRWYERDAGEQCGAYKLFRLKLRN